MAHGELTTIIRLLKRQHMQYKRYVSGSDQAVKSPQDELNMEYLGLLIMRKIPMPPSGLEKHFTVQNGLFVLPF